MGKWFLLLGILGSAAGCGRSTPTTVAPSAGVSNAGTLSITAERSVVLAGESIQLHATATFPDGSVKDATSSSRWTSSDGSVFGVSPTGTISAITYGQATITATAQSLSASIAVTAQPSLRGRVMDYQTAKSFAAATVQFTDSQSRQVTATSDANGLYVLPTLSLGRVSVYVNERYAGMLLLGASTFRGDLLVDSEFCSARYGVITDARTLTPVVGAMISVYGRETTSGPDGWYRLDVGCDSEPPRGGNTTFMLVNHPAYGQTSVAMGRGVYAVERRDIAL